MVGSVGVRLAIMEQIVAVISNDGPKSHKTC